MSIMNRAAIRAEVQNHGFDAVTATRINQWIDNAHQEIVCEDLWPFRKAYIVGAAPLTIAYTGTIESVWDATASCLVEPIDRVELLRRGLTLTDAGGAASYYYFNDESQINTYPTGVSIEVRLFADAQPLADDLATPMLPEKHQQILVDRTCAYAAKEIRDWDAYNVYKSEWQAGLDRMRRDLLTQQIQEPTYIIPG